MAVGLDEVIAICDKHFPKRPSLWGDHDIEEGKKRNAEALRRGDCPGISPLLPGPRTRLVRRLSYQEFPLGDYGFNYDF